MKKGKRSQPGLTVAAERIGQLVWARLKASQERELARREKISRAVLRRLEAKRREAKAKKPRCRVCNRLAWYRTEVNDRVNHYCRTHLLAIAIRKLEADGWRVSET